MALSVRPSSFRPSGRIWTTESWSKVHCEVTCLLPLTRWEICQLFAKIWGKYWLWHPGRSLKGCRQRTGKTYEYYYFFIQDGYFGKGYEFSLNLLVIYYYHYHYYYYYCFIIFTIKVHQIALSLKETYVLFCCRLAQMLMFASTMLTTESTTLGLPDFPVTNLPDIAKIMVSSWHQFPLSLLLPKNIFF